MEISTKSTVQTTKTTDRGTPIVKPGEEMNKNSFLQILAAEMANQDPTKPQDTTAYITQLSQFASLEQMSNLNTTMRMSSAQNVSGKFVALDVYNSSGYQESGVVKSVFKRNNEVYITVEDSYGNLKEYGFDQVTDIMDLPDYNMDNINFINTASLIGKTVEVPGEDNENPIQGVVKEVFRSNEGIKVKIESNGEIKDYLYSNIIKIK
ncbi:flagellar hook capping FlgD N-terminal domain-containing protein [Clostridium sp.]|uniref:flagellar hook assembly protein FlgD n=1 Tax=Clostridium sp. TaxID=1506 RepID=UPI002FCB3C48